MFQKLFILFLLFIMQAGFVCAQKQGLALIDSLLIELPKAKADTNKVKLLNMLSYNYSGNDNNKTIIYARQALQLATSLKWNKGIAIALNNTEPYYIAKYEKDSSIANLLTALAIAEKEKEPAIACQSKIYLGWVYWTFDNSKAMSFFQEALKMSKQINDKLFESYSLYGIGGVYNNLSDFTKALEYYQKANKLAEEINNGYLLESTFSNIASIFFLYDVPKAFQNYKKAAALCEQYGYYEDLALIYGNLSLLYTDGGNYEPAVEYNKKSLAIYERLNEKAGIGTANGNIGYAYIGMHDYVNALLHIQKALDLAKYAPDTQTIDNLTDMVRIYTDAPPSSLLTMGVTSGEALKKAIEYGNKAVELGKKGTALTYLSDAYKFLSLAYEKQRNNEKALETYKQYITIRDSSFNQEKQKEITQKDMQFGFDKKQLADSIKNAEVKKAEAFKLQKQKTYTYTGFAGIGLLLLLLFVIFRFYQRQKKSNLLLSQTLHELTVTQQQLIKSEKMAAFGSLASRLAHEIQNPLNFVNNFSDLSTELVHEIMNLDNKEEREEAAKVLVENLEKINHHGKRAESFIKELLKHSREGTAHQYFEEE